MTVPVFFFVALALAVFTYAVGPGGPIAGLVFFGVLLVGAVVRMLGTSGGDSGRTPAADGSQGE